jgi:hypothetical protein
LTGVDAGNGLMAAVADQKLTIQKKDDSSRYQRYIITGAPVDKGNYVEFSVGWLASGADVPELRALVSIS